MSRKTPYWPFKGGLDLVTPAVQIPEGRTISCLNYEPWINGGYRRVAGYERYDGRLSPHLATWRSLVVDVSTHLNVGDVVTGLNNGNTATIKYISYERNIIAMDDENVISEWENDERLVVMQKPFAELQSDSTVNCTVSNSGLTITRDEDDINGLAFSPTAIESGQDYFFEVTVDQKTVGDEILVGFTTVFTGNTWDEDILWASDGTLYAQGTTQALQAYDNGDVLGFAVDASGGMFFARNGVWLGAGEPGVAAPVYTQTGGEPLYFHVGFTAGGTEGSAVTANFGDSAFSSAPGSFAFGDIYPEEATNLVGTVHTELAPTAKEEGEWLYGYEEDRRAVILPVPGINPIRGIWQYREKVYAFRDDATGTYCIPHQATAAGWDDTLITHTHTMYFDTGLELINEGDTLTGATSGTTGAVHRIIYHGGSTENDDAFGYVTMTSVSGTFVDSEILNIAAVPTATCSGGSIQYAIPAGGRYDFRTANFYASADTYRVYAATGVGPAFEIDENGILSPILMDLTLADSPSENKPHLLEEFDGALWLGFVGGSVQKSVTGSPLQFNGFLGAAEFGLGDEVTGLKATAGKVMVAHTRRTTHGFFAEGGLQKKLLSDRAGGILWGIDELDQIYQCDDSGLVALQRVQAFGDFASATISDLVQPIVVGKKEEIVGTHQIRESNQIRIIYRDGTGIIARMTGAGAEYGLLDYDTQIECCYSCEDESGSPTTWMGGESGYVYQTEVGRNYDGEPITGFIRLPFTHQGQPAVRKRYRLAEIEMESNRYVELFVGQELDYASSDNGSRYWSDESFGGGGFYDNDNWDEIYWDSQVVSSRRFELRGTGENLGLVFYNETATADPFILQGCILHFEPRRIGR